MTGGKTIVKNPMANVFGERDRRDACAPNARSIMAEVGRGTGETPVLRRRAPNARSIMVEVWRGTGETPVLPVTPVLRRRAPSNQITEGSWLSK